MISECNGLIKDKSIGAMLGAATGDALGWPNERIGYSRPDNRFSELSLQEFRSWTRRSGGRYYPYEEIINAGEYSDDTQLMLCVSRALLYGEKWWEQLTQVEIPFWTLYERGGGGATKRAAEAWTNGIAPWKERNINDIKRYFEAGGNGVAMRVLPHVIHNVNSNSFEPIALTIFLDGIATHGHPRALVGALAYGFAVWRSLRRESYLEYGQIAEEVLAGCNEWAKMPNINPVDDSWLVAANKSLYDYRLCWDNVVQEMTQALSICKDELSKGALIFDDEVLKELQCFNPKINGAGTVAAAASIFLSSRYASDPINGVVKAAFAIGTDTDTIASMTGGLLGAISGSNWLFALKLKLQDADYITKIAQDLIDQCKLDREYPLRQVSYKRKYLRKWLDGVTAEGSRGIVDPLPDGRKAILVSNQNQTGRSGKYKIAFRKLKCDDGQTLFLTKISRGNLKQDPHLSLFNNQNEFRKRDIQEQVAGIKLPVLSLEDSVHFYHDFLGIRIKKRSRDVIVLEQGLVLVPTEYTSSLPQDLHFRALVYVRVPDIEGCFSRAKQNAISIITLITLWAKSEMKYFRCLDPDGNVVEVFAAEQKNS